MAATNTMTITIDGQTGTFDLSAQAAGIYTSTGTLSGMEVTLDNSFDFVSDISSQTNTLSETNETGIEPSNIALATDLAGIDTISLEGVAADSVVTVEYDSSTGVLTVNDVTGGNSGTVDIGTAGGNGVQDFTISSGSLAGTVVTVDTNTFDFDTTFSDTTTAVASTNGDLALAATAASTSFDATEIRNFDEDTIQFVVSSADGSISSTSTAGYTVSVNGANDFDQTAADVVLDVTHDASGEVFQVTVDVTTAAGTADSTVTLTLNELHNAVAADSDDLVVGATAPTLSNFDADDLAALDATAISLNVDAQGRVIMTSGPSGFSVDQTSSQDLATSGDRNVVLSDGNNSFTVTLDVTTAISQGSADLDIDLLELQNQFGLGTEATDGRYSATVQIFDSLGNAHDLVLEFDKVATNSWEILVNDPVLASTGVTSGTVTSATRSINFNGDGTPSAISFADIDITGWTTGADDSTVAFDLGTVGESDGVTQFAGEFSLSSIDQDGVRFGGFVGVNIDELGTVTAVFDNGEQLPVYQLPITLFANPNGLESVTGNAFRQTDRSGDILLQQANAGGAGTVAASALESSTVDLAEEFTKMITTQRAYSASARIITTADDMLEELIRIRR
ncbi:MAG: flagellar hook-basal body complex protein [Gemmatimonadetes bacterium]|uniref:Flagellar hook protein FlgE n=1 Tax=Candidatus Kutchimonas denitrificans TaxID=3056748 RepID=A0AAE4ZBP8_9BACT|nr:flagellar hook-basal body complex protein [Candidatus Kutchimonas denitrificans]